VYFIVIKQIYRLLYSYSQMQFKSSHMSDGPYKYLMKKVLN